MRFSCAKVTMSLLSFAFVPPVAAPPMTTHYRTIPGTRCMTKSNSSKCLHCGKWNLFFLVFYACRGYVTRLRRVSLRVRVECEMDGKLARGIR
ncbi:hypothetical protein V8C42DRAFT_61413 [Trichoderma barbatum]